MRKFVVPAILISVVAVSAPAAAQYRGHHNQGAGIERQLDQLERRIDNARDRRLISRYEAARLDAEAERIDRLHDRYRRNGLNQRERHELQNRIDRLRAQFRWERRADRR